MARNAATVSVGVQADSASIRRTEQEVKRALDSLNKLGAKGISSKAFTQPLGRITGSVDEFTKSLEASNARVLAFAASAGQLYLVERAFSKLLETTVQVEKQLAEINVIMNLSTKGLAKFGDSLYGVARQTGQSFKVVAESALEFSRQGLSVEKTLIRVRDAMILARLSGMEVVAATNAITAALNSFNDAALNSTRVVNKLANVDMAFAVSSEDLANAIQRSAAAAESAKVSFDELLAITTAVQQKTQRGGAVIGNSLKSIFTRIQRSRVRESLENLGVSTRDMAGNIRPAIDILQDFAKTYETLGDSAKAYAAELMGGVFQVNILKAAVSDLSKEYSIYRGALRKAMDATNEAISRNEKLGETLHHQVQETIAAVEQFAATTGKLTFGPAIERVMGIIRGIADALTVKDADSIGGKIGEGILQGIGNVLKAPGLVALGAILAKLVYNFGKFTIDAVKTFTGMNKAAQEHANIQTIINNILMKNPALIATMTKNTEAQVVVEQKLLQLVRQRKLEMQQAATISASVATNILPAYMAGGKGPKGGGKTRAFGHIPNLSRRDDGAAESIGAAMGGYKPGKIKQMNIRGLGQVTYNSREAVREVPGFAQPAIIPPKGSRAGTAYRKEFRSKMGYSADSLSSGFVPNFLPDSVVMGFVNAATKPGAKFGDAINALSKLEGGRALTSSGSQLRRVVDSYLKKPNTNFIEKQQFLKTLSEAAKEDDPKNRKYLRALFDTPSKSIQGDLYEIDQRRKLLSTAKRRGIKLSKSDRNVIMNDPKGGADLPLKGHPKVRQAMASMLSSAAPGTTKFDGMMAKLSGLDAIDWKRTATIKGSQHVGRGTGFLGLYGKEGRSTKYAGSQKMVQSNAYRKRFRGMFGPRFARFFGEGLVPNFMDPLQILTGEMGGASAGTGAAKGGTILRHNKDVVKVLDDILKPALINAAGEIYGPESAKAAAQNLKNINATSLITGQGSGRFFEAMVSAVTGNTVDSKAIDLKGGKLSEGVRNELKTAVPGWDPEKRTEVKLSERSATKAKTKVNTKIATDLFERLVVPQWSKGTEQYGKMMGPAFVRSTGLDEEGFKKKYFASRSGKLLKGEKFSKFVEDMRAFAAKNDLAESQHRTRTGGFDRVGFNTRLKFLKLKSAGMIPNFAQGDPLSDAIGREISAGYNASQVKVGFDSRLQKSGGVGVYNTTEGSLSNAINIHRRQGKSMAQIQTAGAAAGLVPNLTDMPYTAGVRGGKPGGVTQFVQNDFIKTMKLSNDQLKKFQAGLGEVKQLKALGFSTNEIKASFDDVRKKIEKAGGNLKTFDKIVDTATKSTKKNNRAVSALRQQFNTATSSVATLNTATSAVAPPPRTSAGRAARTTVKMGTPGFMPTMPMGVLGGVAPSPHLRPPAGGTGATSGAPKAAAAGSSFMSGPGGLMALMAPAMLGGMGGSLFGRGSSGEQKFGAVMDSLSTAGLIGFGAASLADTKTFKKMNQRGVGGRSSSGKFKMTPGKGKMGTILKAGQASTVGKILTGAAMLLPLVSGINAWNDTTTQVGNAADKAASVLSQESQNLQNLLQATAKYREAVAKYGGGASASSNPIVMQQQMEMATELSKQGPGFASQWKKLVGRGADFTELETLAARKSSVDMLQQQPAFLTQLAQGGLQQPDQAADQVESARLSLLGDMKGLIQAVNFKTEADRATFVQGLTKNMPASFDDFLTRISGAAKGDKTIQDLVQSRRLAGGGAKGKNMQPGSSFGQALQVIQTFAGATNLADDALKDYIEALKVAAQTQAAASNQVKTIGAFGAAFQKLGFEMEKFSLQMASSNKMAFDNMDNFLKVAGIRDQAAKRRGSLFLNQEGQLAQEQFQGRRAINRGRRIAQEKNQINLNKQASEALFSFSAAIGDRTLNQQEAMFSQGKLTSRFNLAQSMSQLGGMIAQGQVDRRGLETALNTLKADAAKFQGRFGQTGETGQKQAAAEYRTAAQALETAINQFDENGKVILNSAHLQRVAVEAQIKAQKDFLAELRQINLFGGFDQVTQGTALDKISAAMKTKQVGEDIGGDLGSKLITKANVSLATFFSSMGFTSENMPNRNQMVQEATNQIQSIYDRIGYTPTSPDMKPAAVAEKQFRAKFKERFDQPDITENPADAGRGKSSFHEAATGMTKSLDKTAEALELLNKTLGGEGKDKDKDMMTSAVEQGAGKYLHGSPPYLKTVAENTRGLKDIPVRADWKAGEDMYSEGLLKRFPQLTQPHYGEGPLRPGEMRGLQYYSSGMNQRDTQVGVATLLNQAELAGSSGGALGRRASGLRGMIAELANQRGAASDPISRGMFRAQENALSMELAPIDEELKTREAASEGLGMKLGLMIKEAMQRDFNKDKIATDPFGEVTPGKNVQAAKAQAEAILNQLKQSGQAQLVEIANAAEREMKRAADSGFDDVLEYNKKLVDWRKAKEAEQLAREKAKLQAVQQQGGGGNTALATGALALRPLMMALAMPTDPVSVGVGLGGLILIDQLLKSQQGSPGAGAAAAGGGALAIPLAGARPGTPFTPGHPNRDLPEVERMVAGLLAAALASYGPMTGTGTATGSPFYPTPDLVPPPIPFFPRPLDAGSGSGTGSGTGTGTGNIPIPTTRPVPVEIVRTVPRAIPLDAARPFPLPPGRPPNQPNPPRIPPEGPPLATPDIDPRPFVPSGDGTQATEGPRGERPPGDSRPTLGTPKGATRLPGGSLVNIPQELLFKPNEDAPARTIYTRQELLQLTSNEMGLASRRGDLSGQGMAARFTNAARRTQAGTGNRGLETQVRLNDIQQQYSEKLLQSNIAEADKIELLERLGKVNQKLVETGAPLSQALKAMTAEAERAALQQAALEYDMGDITTEQLQAQIRSTNEAAIREGTYGVSNMLKSVMGELEYSSHDFWMSVDEDLRMVASSLREGIADSLFKAIKDTEKFSDAMGAVFQEIGDRLLKRGLQRTVDFFIDALMNAVGGMAGGGRYFNQGGMVTGGSGVRDDIPAMLQGGEFVMRKSAVNKYGPDFMESLNAGATPQGYANGGLVKVGVRKSASDSFLVRAGLPDGSGWDGQVRRGIYDSGFSGKTDDGRIIGGAAAIGAKDKARQELAQKIIAQQGMQSKYVEKPRGASVLLANEFLVEDAKRPGMGVINTDPRLSALALQSDINPQNAIRDELEQSLHDYFMDHAQHKADYQETVRRFHEQRKKRAKNMMIGAAMQIGMHAVSAGLMNIGNNMRANAASASMDRINAGQGTKADYNRVGNWLGRTGQTDAAQTMKFTGKMIDKGYTPEQINTLTGVGGMNVYRGAVEGGLGHSEFAGMDVRGDFGNKIGSQIYGNKGMSSWMGSQTVPSGKSGAGMLGYDPISQQNLGWRGFLSGQGAEGRMPFRAPRVTGRNRGGMMYGGDNIPALLTGGEYVINKDSVGKYGVDFFEQLNANRYRNGGYVGEGRPQPAGSTGVGGEMTNNINITVNVDKDGASVTSVDSSSRGSAVSEEERSRQLAEKVNSAVLTTIIDQKKPGGLLYE